MLESLLFLEDNFPWFIPVFLFILGAAIGSFLNVCIYRIPAGRSVVKPRSACACGKPIAWYDNIPILSWFILRGKARCCGQPYSFRYPAIEAFTGLLFCGAWLAQGDTPAKALCLMVMLSMLICGSFIDFDHMEIPNRFSIGLAAVGFILSVGFPSLHFDHASGPAETLILRSGLESLLGILIGSGLVLWIALLAETILKKEAMGFGDVKLLGGIGAFLGWQGAVFSLFGGAVIGSLAVASFAMAQKLFAGSRTEDTKDESVLGRQIPFGPMLAAGAAFYALVLEGPVDAYFEQVALIVRDVAAALPWRA